MSAATGGLALGVAARGAAYAPAGASAPARALDVLYTSTLYPPATGGAHNHLHRLARTLAGRGHRVRVLTHSAAYRRDWLRMGTVAAARETAYVHEGVPVTRLGNTAAGRLARLPWACAYYAATGRAVRAVADRLRPDVERLGGAPDAVHAVRIGREFLTQASLDFARRRGVPFVLTPCHHPRWRGPLYREFDRLYREADALVALTPEERRALVEEKGVAAERVAVVGVGPLLADAFDPAALAADHGVRGRFVLFLGQQLRYKGVGTLLDAAPAVWRRHPDVTFVFAGPGSPYARERFAAVRDPRVRNLGEVSLTTKTALLGACALLCLPSTQESFGGVFTEAWAMGRPVVGGRIPPVAAVVDDGVDGLLAEPEPGDVARAVTALLDDPAAAGRMGAAGRAKVEARYTWDAIARATERVYARAQSGAPQWEAP